MTVPARAKKRAAVTLSKEAIQTAALALIDRDGLEAFSTRKLGKALGCEAMAIYWYYPSKDALLGAVMDLLVEPLEQIARTDADDWVTVLRNLAHAYRGISRNHPKAFPLLATRRFTTAGAYAFLERLFELARRHDLSDDTTARYYRIVSSYCSGYALNELAAPRNGKDAGGAKLRRKFPRVEAVFARLEPAHLDDLFSQGLELILESLAAQPGLGARGEARAKRTLR